MLDVGTGSGYAAAVLAELAAEVHTIERIPELADGARAALAAAGYERVAGPRRRRWRGLPEQAPFDAIAVAAAAPECRRRSGRSSARAGASRCRSRPGAGRSSSACSSGRRAGPALLASVPARFVPLVHGDR